MSEVERQVLAYCVINIDNNPANLDRNEKMAREGDAAYLSENGNPNLQQD
jgi:hypothetical protein